jgi:hypothetical protein
MASSYTVESVHALLRALVAPDIADRKAADSLMSSLFSASGGEKNPQMAALIDAATTRFGAEERDFLRDLTLFWMDASAIAFASRMKGFGSRADAKPQWQPSPHVPVFFCHGRPSFQAFELFGMGIGEYLLGQSARLGFLVPQLQCGLAHPEPLVADRCWTILGNLPAAPIVAFPAMRDMAFERGARFAPDQPMRALAAIVAAHPSLACELAEALRSNVRDQRIEVICELAGHLPQVPDMLADALRERFDGSTDAAERCSLFVALTQIGQGVSSPATLGLLECAETLSQSNDPLLRAASAWGLARMGNVESHEAAMIALVRDTGWVTRSNACLAVAAWVPTPELAIAVADRLGDCDGYDGYPHANALHTLIAWKQQSAPAVARIGRWLDEAEVDAGELSADSLLELLQSLGPQSVALVPQVTRFVAANWHEESEQNADAEADKYGEDEPADEPFDLSSFIEGLDLPDEIVAQLPVEAMQKEIDDLAGGPTDLPDDATCGGSDDLVQRIGLDPNEDIPGTRSSKELAEEPDTEVLLRRWIARMS